MKSSELGTWGLGQTVQEMVKEASVATEQRAKKRKPLKRVNRGPISVGLRPRWLDLCLEGDGSNGEKSSKQDELSKSPLCC